MCLGTTESTEKNEATESVRSACSVASVILTRPTLGHYMANREELLGRANDLFKWMEAGELEIRIDRTFPLKEAAEAHRYLEGRQTKGKVVLRP